MKAIWQALFKGVESACNFKALAENVEKRRNTWRQQLHFHVQLADLLASLCFEKLFHHTLLSSDKVIAPHARIRAETSTICFKRSHTTTSNRFSYLNYLLLNAHFCSQFLECLHRYPIQLGRWVAFFVSLMSLLMLWNSSYAWYFKMKDYCRVCSISLFSKV